MSDEARADRHEYRQIAGNLSTKLSQVSSWALQANGSANAAHAEFSTEAENVKSVQKMATLANEDVKKLHKNFDRKISDLNKTLHVFGYTLVYREDHQLRKDVDRKIRDLNQSMQELGSTLVQRENSKLRQAMNSKIGALNESMQELRIALTQRDDQQLRVQGHQLHEAIKNKIRALNVS